MHLQTGVSLGRRALQNWRAMLTSALILVAAVVIPQTPRAQTTGGDPSTSGGGTTGTNPTTGGNTGSNPGAITPEPATFVLTGVAIAGGMLLTLRKRKTSGPQK